MKFSKLAAYFEKLEGTTSRNQITQILAEIFRESEENEIDKICYLALGELVPPYKGIEFNIAEKMLIRIISVAYGVAQDTVLKNYKNLGDLGDVAEELSKKSKTKPYEYSVERVYDALFDIATDSGAGSQERKIKKMAELLNAVDSKSAKFITRIPAGKLRLGFSEATILDSLSIMAKKDKSARPIIERAFNVTADIGEVAKIIKKHGVEALEKINPKPGIPIRPSLAERIPDPEEIIKKLGPVVAIEPKLDGFRTAVHIWTSDDKKNVLLFSRNLENMTEMFPEVISSAKKLNVNSIILDGEAIGYDPKSGRFTKFQETIQRKRKYGISEFVKRIPLSVFVFDILYLNGKSLIDEPFSERRKILEKIINKDFGAIKLTEQYLGKSAQDIEKYLIEETKRGLEGIVIKNLNSPYEAGTRGFHWVKFKPTSAALIKLRKEEKTKLADTIDCVVMGAYKGRGKRAEFGVGGFLLGVRGEDNRYYTISKLGSGLSDEDFKEMFKRIKDLKVNSQPKEYVVTKEMIPDIWVKPSLVVEILSDEITLSPRHTAGRKKERGYSLRFPRLVRFREDKNPEDSTSIKEIERMYKIQKKF